MISAFGGGKRLLYEAVCVVRLLIVDRRPFLLENNGLDEFGKEDLDAEAFIGRLELLRLRASAGDEGGEGSG